MGHADDILSEIRKQTDARPDALTAARDRTHLVRREAATLYGALRTYTSGSLAHHTQNDPVNDGDGGLVLDRRCYPRLGPEGGGEAPGDVVKTLCGLLGPAIREPYPNARCGTSKRGPKVSFGAPLPDGQDPTVDLVVALTRREGDGLWIPNLERGTWEASHPEGHTALFNAHDPNNASLRGTRRKVTRALKAWNKQYGEPAFSSFHLSVLACEFTRSGLSVARALLEVLEGLVARHEAGQATKDPCRVSKDIRLLLSDSVALRRARTAREAVAAALACDGEPTDSAARAALAKMFFTYLDDGGLAQVIDLARERKPLQVTSVGIAGAGLVSAARAYGA